MKLTKKVNLIEAVENVKGDAFDIHDEVKAVDTPPYVDAVKRMERNKKKVKKAMEPAEKAKDELIDLTVKRKANKTPKLESLVSDDNEKVYIVAVVCWVNNKESDTEYIEDFATKEEAIFWIKENRNQLLRDFLSDDIEAIDVDVEEDNLGDEHSLISHTKVVYTLRIWSKESESLEEAKESGQHIYLFPICEAIEPILDCNYFGLRLLGANYFDGEENYVVKGDLSDLRDFAEYVGYELHPDYLYKDDEFAGEIVEIGNAVEESCKSLKENTDDNRTLKDILSERKSFVVDVPLDSKHHLFIEGLSELGEAIDGEFSIDKVYNCIVEVHETGEDLIETLSGPFSLDTKLSTLMEKAEEVVKSLGENINKNRTLKEDIVFDEVNGFHIEYGHSLEEYMRLWGDLYKEGELWDFSFDDVKSKAIEPNENMVYWALIDEDGELRVYETYKFEEFEESCNSLKEDVKLICGLSDYRPWSGAVTTWDKLEELDLIDELDSMLEEMYPEGLTMTQLNDILWFESDWIFETLGVSEDNDEDEDDENDDEDEEGEDGEEDFWSLYHKLMAKHGKKTSDLNEGNTRIEEMNKPEIKNIVGTDGVPCLLVNNRYQIYLDDGSVYDTVHAKDIPQYVFNIRDRAMKMRKELRQRSESFKLDWCKSEKQLNDRIKSLGKGNSIEWNDNEKKFIDKLNEFKGYAKGELELDKIGGGWFPLDYREDSGDAFYIETDGQIKPLITDKEAEEKGIDIIKCCDECNIFYCVD